MCSPDAGRGQRQEGGGGGTVASAGIGAGQVETQDNATEYAGQDGEQGADQEESGKGNRRRRIVDPARYAWGLLRKWTAAVAPS